MWTGEKQSFSKTLTSQHRFMTYQSRRSVLWGSREGILLVFFLLWKFECRISLSIMEFRCRISNCECHSVFVWTGIFSKTLLVWTRIFLKTDKKDAFSKISGYVWMGPYIGKQGLKLIFKPNSINCFVLARNPASMLQIRNGTYQNVPRSSNYIFRYFVSSSAVSDIQKFAAS